MCAARRWPISPSRFWSERPAPHRIGPAHRGHALTVAASAIPCTCTCTAQPVMLKAGFVQRVRVLRGEKARDDALARELGAMGLL